MGAIIDEIPQPFPTVMARLVPAAPIRFALGLPARGQWDKPAGDAGRQHW